MTPVTDPALLAQLNGGGMQPVQDPHLLALLNSDHSGDEPQQPGMLDQIGRQLGLTGRYALEGAGNLAGMVTDPIGQFIPGYQKGGEGASNIADSLGLPKPQGGLEQTIGAASRALAGSGLTAGVGAAAQIPLLADQAGLQAASSMLGAGGAESARQSGAGEGTQAGVGLAASLLPGGITAGSAAAVRGALRGNDPQAMKDTMAAFEGAGTAPSVGQATQGRFSQGLESLLSKLPGSSGVMANKAKTQAGEMGAQMGRYADELAPGSDPTEAGAAIQRGITGEDGFIDRFKKQAGVLYDKVDQFMPADSPTPVSATSAFLAKATTPTPGAEATSSLLSNPKLAQIAQAVGTDTGANGTMPYAAIKALRSRVGDMMADSGLMSDVPRGQLKQLYGALSTDLRTATQGNPEAFAANNAAENFYRNGMGQIEKVESVVNRNGGPEKVFQAAMSGTREGASTLSSVVSALKPEESNVIASAVMRRMGRANPSAQNDIGDTFSTQTFLTNWNGMSPQAKQVLFDRMGPGFRSNMDKIAKVTSNLRDGSQVFRNPSGTAPAMAQIGTAAGLATSIMSGNAAGVAAIGGGLAASNVIARAWTNPTFVKWLARNTTAPVGVLPAQLGYLSQLGKNKKDPDLTDVAQLLGTSLQQTGN